MTESKLIITTSDSGMGHLKASNAGNRYVAVWPTLVWSELPDAPSFFQSRPTPSQSEQDQNPFFKNLHWFHTNIEFDSPLRTEWPAFRDLIKEHERIELWIDPDPNSQLVLMLLLDYLQEGPDCLGKIWLYQSPARLGEGVPDRWRAAQLPLKQIDWRSVALASRVWRAYSAPTPEGVTALLQEDLSAFPFLKDGLVDLLDELPGAQDGVGATQRAILRELAEADRLPADLLGYTYDRPRTFGYWQLGAILDELCTCSLPPITGLEEGPFTLEMHDDAERFQHYFESRLTLTDFGQALLDGKADFAKENRIDRWWGGTRLTNDSLWRWDGGKLSHTP